MTKAKKSILYLAHRIPFPPNKGDKIRSFNEIKYLSGEHDLHLVFLIDDPQDIKHVEELEQYSKSIDYALIDPRRQKLKSIPHLLTNKPLSVPCFYSSTLQRAIDRRLDETEIDVVFCFSSPMAEYVFRSRHYNSGRLKKVRLIMDFVDVDSDKWRMYAGFTPFPLSAIYRREWRRLQAYDAQVGRLFDWSVFVSEKEVELFRSFSPGARTTAIPNGVDIEYFSKVQQLRRQVPERPPTVIFVGAMDYYPNEDAVVHFADDILPLVKEKVPDVRFCIVGNKPTERVKALAERDGIVVTGFVPDVRPWLAEADLFVAPFRIARGIQNKVLEAMAAGVPVVARPEAVQGLGENTNCLLVESTVEGFAAAVVESLLDQEKRAAIGAIAKRCVHSSFRWNTNMETFRRLLI